MSKLSDKIRKIGKTEPAPMGFAAVATREKPATLLCVVRLADGGKAAEAASNGADIVIVEEAAKLKGLDKADGAVVGVSGEFDQEAARELRKSGVDFIVVPGAAAPAAGLLEEKVGRVLAVAEDADDTTLRLIGDLGLDALLISAPELPLTVERLLAVRRVSVLAHTALLVAVPADIDGVSLRLIRDSGAAGVVIDDAGSVGALKERITGLPARSKAKEEKREPLLPLQSSGYDDDDDDDDWDD
ncbi:MAG TPA: hypothetical protein VMR52_13820 [Dehalococcoidia bacterium]|nr:hypothetical protein [Dehalococcoidia bacterium]